MRLDASEASFADARSRDGWEKVYTQLDLPEIADMAAPWSGIPLISRALGIGAEVVRDAFHLQQFV